MFYEQDPKMVEVHQSLERFYGATSFLERGGG